MRVPQYNYTCTDIIGNESERGIESVRRSDFTVGREPFLWYVTTKGRATVIFNCFTLVLLVLNHFNLGRFVTPRPDGAEPRSHMWSALIDNAPIAQRDYCSRHLYTVVYLQLILSTSNKTRHAAQNGDWLIEEEGWQEVRVFNKENFLWRLKTIFKANWISFYWGDLVKAVKTWQIEEVLLSAEKTLSRHLPKLKTESTTNWRSSCVY